MKISSHRWLDIIFLQFSIVILSLAGILAKKASGSSPYLCVNSPRQECELKNLKNRHQ
jgi:hypothetical protein